MTPTAGRELVAGIVQVFVNASGWCLIAVCLAVSAGYPVALLAAAGFGFGSVVSIISIKLDEVTTDDV